MSALFFTGMMITVGYTNAQVCVPDPQYTQPGLYPDSIANLDSGMVGVLYSDTITAVVPTDTVDGSGNCCNPVAIDSMVITSIGGLPPGLSYQCEPPNCQFPGGTSACILISGTPTDTGTFSITADVTAYVECCLVLSSCLTCIQVPQSSVVNYYTIVISPSACPSPVADFTFTTFNLTADFTDASTTTGTTIWSWDFGDGSPVDSTQNPSHTYASDSIYNVCLTVTDSCGNNTYCDNVAVTSAPCTLSDSISSTDETIAGIKDGTATVVVSGGTPPYTFNWGIDTIVTTNTTSTITGLAPGDYSVTITDSDGCEKDAGPVTVGAGPSGIQSFDDLTKRVLVYPNPVVNELYIITSFDEQVIFIIYDIVGKQIKSVVIESKTTRVNTTELTEGMYIYQVLSKEGIMLNRGKFSIAK